MSSIGTGYDLSATTFSPDGRVFQVEYASKAVDSSGTAVGIKCKEGIVLGVEKLITSKLLVSNANRRIGTADFHVGLVSAGLQADGRHLVNRAQEECESYRNIYKMPIPGRYLAERVAMYVQAHTLYSSVRPFGTSTIVGVVDKARGPQIYMIEPSGVYFGYQGIVVGKGKQNAKTEIEKLNFDELTAREAVNHVARIIHFVHDEAKDRDFELEMSWICPESKNRHELVPAEIVREASELAKQALHPDMDAD